MKTKPEPRIPRRLQTLRKQLREAKPNLRLCRELTAKAEKVLAGVCGPSDLPGDNEGWVADLYSAVAKLSRMTLPAKQRATCDPCYLAPLTRCELEEIEALGVDAILVAPKRKQ